MTDYRNKFGNSENKITLVDSVRKEELFDQNGNKIIQSISDNSYNADAESERYVKAYIKQRSRYIPELDYSDPSTFSYYGSAEKYYDDSIKRVYNTYPYDGSKAEKMEWSLTASYLDLYMLEHEYPKAKGHVTFASGGWGSRTAVEGNYGLSSNPEYIYFVGGPHSGTIFNSSKSRENNLKIDGTKGNTVEFWLKKQSFVESTMTAREVIFDVHTTGAVTGTSIHGRFMLSLDSAVGSGSPFKLTYLSGTAGFTDQVIGTSEVTKATIADNLWHYYAVTVLHSGSSLISKLYVDGTLQDTNTTSVASFGAVDRNFVGTIGALATASAGTGKLGYGKLSGSLDEFRYWKEARSEKQIGRYWYRPVHGGTDKDNSNPNLGLYYKFNEGITNIKQHDEVVLDYSGRINNGKITGWSTNFRSSESGIELSSNLPETSYTEPGDPIINSKNSLVQAVIEKFEKFGKSHDLQNGSSLTNTIPSYFMLEDDRGHFQELVQIIASTLDDIFLKVKFLPKVKDYAYRDFFSEKGVHQSISTNDFLLGCEDSTDFKFTGHHSKPWVNYILEHFGLVTTEIFPNADLFETFMQKSEKATFEQNLHEVKNAILSNIHSSLIHIYNTKGTENSFRNLIRCFGVDDELIKLNVYGNNEEYRLETKPIYTTVKQKSVNFAGANYQGTIYQTASKDTSLEERFITASASPKPITIDANIIFPAQSSIQTNLVTSSLFGMHSVQGPGEDVNNHPLTWHSIDTGSVQVYFVRRSNFKAGGYFLLTSSAGVFTAVSSSHIPDVYDNNHWNIAVRVAKKGDIDFGLTKLSGSTGYKVELIGNNYDLDVLKNSFHISSSITRAQYEKLSLQDRAVYAGSHKTNFTGSHIHSSDIRLLGLNVYLDGLTDDELKEHAKNPAVYGRRDPQHVSNFDDGGNLLSGESLVLRWQFGNLVSSSAEGKLSVLDFSSGSNTVPGGLGDREHKYRGAGVNFPSTGSAIVQEFISSLEYAPIDNVYSSDRVKVKTTEVEKFTSDSRPVTYFYSFEKSMYQVISKEMINMFAGITGISNLIGEPVNKYRQEYKLMEKMRQKFFSKVENDIDLDKFVEYYKWIDASLSHFLQQLVPASSNFAGRIRDIVESHVLERNKYKYQAPTMEYKDGTIKPTSMLGVNELLYDWEHGHAPLSGNENENCLWQKDRSERANNRETIRRTRNINVSGSTYVVRKLSRPYRFGVEQSRPISTGFNRKTNKNPELYKMATQAGKIQLTSSNLTEEPVCSDVIEPNLTEHYRGSTDVINSNSYLDADSDLLFPFTMISSSVGVDLEQVKENLQIGNNHLDIGIHGESSLQSPFTRQHVGGMPHRKVEVSLSPNPAQSVGSITMAAGTSPGALQGDKFTLTDALGASQEFTFDLTTTSKTGGTIGISGVGVVQHKVEAMRDAINNIAGLGITAGAIVNTDDAGFDGDHKLTLTQNIPGPSGDTTIDTSGVTNVTSENFTGGVAAMFNRPEAYNLTASGATMLLTTAAIDNPKSMFYRDSGFGTGYMFKNVKHGTGSNILGNYNKDYEIVLTNGRSLNNNQIADDDGFSYAPVASKAVSGTIDFVTPVRQRTSHVIVNKFSAPGGPETQAAFASDQESQEYSIYNTLNYRNSTIRNTLDKLSGEQSDQFGYRSGSTTQASVHMTNRNASRRTGSLGKEVNFDNNFVQHPIPQTEYQYSWVTASVGDSVYNFLSRNNNSGYVNNFKLKNSSYTRDFSQETSGTIPTDYKTNQSERTSSFVDITRIETIKESPDNSSFRFANQVSISHDVVAVINNREQETTDTTLYIFRSGASGYVQEFASVVAKASEPVYGTSNSGPKQAIVTSVTNHGSWVACAVSGGASSPTPDCIKIFRSSSSGWTLNEGLTGSAIGFKSPAHLAMTASSSGVYRLAAINTGSVKIFTHFSASGWYNSGNNVTDLTAIATHSPATQSSGLAAYYGYLSIHGDLATAGSRIVVGNQDGFSVLLSGSGWSEEDTIVPSDWSWKPNIATNFNTSEVFSIPFIHEPANFKNNIDLHEDVFAIITNTAREDSLFPMSYSTPKLQVWKRSGSNWGLYQEMDPIFSDHAENSNTRVLSIAIDKGLLFVGVTEKDIYFDGNTFQGESGEQDYGSIVVYADDGSSYKKQRELFSGEPADRGGLGSSMRAKGGKLIAGAPAISTYAKSRNPTLSYHLSTDITNAVIFEYKQTAETDKSLRGPKIAGPENSRAFAMSGQSSFFTEVEQIPSILVGSLGKKLRVIEKTNLVTQKIPEFVVELEYIQGSNDASDVANSSYGLTNDPGGFFVVQYKLGNGTWKNTSIHTTGGNKNSFTKIRSKPINNPDNKKIGLRILNVTDEFSQAEWAFKNINIIPSRDSYDSSKQLIKDTQYRSVSTRQIHNSVNSVFFDGAFQELSASTPNSAPIFFTADGAGGNDNPFSVQAWLKPEVTRGGHRIILDLPRNYFMSISSSVDNPAYLDFTFSCYSSSFGDSWNPTYQNRLGIKKSSFLENGKWSNVVVTYDGSKDFNGFALYLNGQRNVDAEKFNLVRSGQNYHGMAGPGRSDGGGITRRHLCIGLPGQFSEGDTNIETTLSYRGYINNLVIFNKKLQASEVFDLYQMKNKVSDLSIESGDILDFKHTSLHSDAVLWYPFTTLGSASKGSALSPLYYDQINNMEIRLSNAQRLAPTFIPRIQSTTWDVPNTADTYTINSDTNTINSISSTGSYLQNTLSPYSWPTWKQVRGSENPITMKHRKENVISIVTRGTTVFPSPHSFYNFDFNKNIQNIGGNVKDSAKRTVDRTIVNYTEPMVTNRFNPMTITVHNENANGLSIEELTLRRSGRVIHQNREERLWNMGESTFSALIGLGAQRELSQIRTGDLSAEELANISSETAEDNRLLIARKTYQNDLTSFANQELREKLRINDFRNHPFLSIVQSLQREFSLDEGISLEVNYVETLYPREQNTYTKNARTREKFNFFGWNSSRPSRTITLTGSNSYNSSLIQAGVSNLFPDITIDKFDYQRTNPFFVDAVDSDSSTNPTRFLHIRTSRWPLDARENFNRKPLSITGSFFNQGKDFLPVRKQGRFGEGVLQNDYSIFGLGVNTVHGTPPPAPIYSRRIPQKYTVSHGVTGSLLAGEAKWEVADQSGTSPFTDSYENHREKLRSLAQDHSLVPEFRISEFIEDIILNNNSDFLDSVSINENFLSLTGAIYNQSSGDISIGSTFFKTYGTSDFMKYFSPVLKRTEVDGAQNDVDPHRLTLKCQAAMKFIPYTGFYPAERTVQIAELFARGYLPEFSFTNTKEDSRIAQTDAGVRNLLERKIRANLQQSIKPLMAPGLLFNSIKSGMAVDYPLFGSSTDEAAITAFKSNIDANAESLTGSFGGEIKSLIMFTGSLVNATNHETASHNSPGRARLSGSVYRRVVFEELLEPDKLKGLNILDQEPHPSASLYYGSKHTARIFDYPFQFGQLDAERNRTKLNAADFSIKKPLSETLLPYKMAINNFCAETINFFIEDGTSATLESGIVDTYLKSGEEYKMRVYIKNKDLMMYDRHSAFGPPVDEGRNLVKDTLIDSSTTVKGTSATILMGLSNYNFDLPNGQAGVGEALPGIILSASGGGKVAIKFFNPDQNSSPAGFTNRTTAARTESGDTNISSVANLYVNTTSSYIDLKSIHTNFTNTLEVFYDQDQNIYLDNNRSSGLAKSIFHAIEDQRLRNSTGIGANLILQKITDTNTFPSTVPSEAEYFRYNVEIFQVASATASAGSTWKLIPESASGSTAQPQDRMRHYFPDFPTSASFSGGSNDIVETKKIEGGTLTRHFDHGFAPFHPPFLDRGAEPYVDISFTPSDATGGSKHYTLDEIIENSTYTYSNFYQTPSNASTAVTRKNNTNFHHAMSISASIDLQGFSVYSEDVAEGSSDDRDKSKRWVIQTKWETPLLQFSDVKTSALRLDNNTVYQTTGSPWQDRNWTQYFTKLMGNPDPFLTASTGMWHQYGSIPDLVGEGYEISVEEIPGLHYQRQLSRKVGFTKPGETAVTAKSGIISEFKEISEAVVAVPYYVQDGNKVEFFDISPDVVEAAATLNNSKKQALENGEISAQEYQEFFDNPGQSSTLFAAYQMRMMNKFIIPPQFDFVKHSKLLETNRPLMYIFQFNAAMTRNDLRNIWQNTAPSSATSGGKLRYSGRSINSQTFGLKEDIQYVSHFLDLQKMPFEVSDRQSFLEEKVRWIVFKAKMAAEKDLAKIKRNSLPGYKSGKKILQSSFEDTGYFYKDSNTDPIQNESNGPNGLRHKYSFNWPYDYFSIVELIKLEGKVDFLPKVLS